MQITEADFMQNNLQTVFTHYELNPFQPNIPFLYPLKMSENIGILTVLGGAETGHWTKMG